MAELAGALIASDDYTLHQTAETLLRVGSDHPKWTERWYFNLQSEDGTLHGICGGGFYPQAGVLEVYACVLADGHQHNLRQRVRATNRERLDIADRIQFAIEAPMRAWTIRARGATVALELRFDASQSPYLFPPFVVAADRPPDGSALVIDQIQHFTQAGTIEGRLGHGGRPTALRGVSFRDRTWGVRSARPRLHNWYAFHLSGGASLNLIHQERADGAVMVSHLAYVDSDGSVRTGVLDTHELSFDRDTRQLLTARYTGHDADGAAIDLDVVTTGPGVRLVGAGYTAAQGDADTFDRAQEESWDLADPALVARVGRGTMDSPARARLDWGGHRAEGPGVTETALARDHWRYGHQLEQGDRR